ncbi:Permeases of the major facilitator superfamily [plant metagenome]|uniref:Permeases of the major facilitator superfamily n=1 Tax=plant metagenome TaxID=1297885 RepID=A0A484QSP9_9ZZZZ
MMATPAPALPGATVFGFAAASGLSVSTVYYAHPLLDILARDFGISPASIGGAVTATQLGCALALLILVPLGDRLDRRRLMAWQWLGLAGALAAVASAPSSLALLLGMLAVGMLGTAMTQGLIAYAASAAAPQEQGRVVGAAQGGVFIGLLLARVFSGAVSDLAGWRGVYLCAALLMLLLALPLLRLLPRLPRSATAASPRQLLASMLSLLRQERILRARGVLALLMFAAFNVFWSALTLHLSAPPHAFGHTAIGAFGLVGAVGALAASRAGYWTDQGHARRVTLAALVLLLLAWWPLSWLDHSLGALVLGIVLLDLGGQALHVSNQALILRARPDAHGRLVSLYMLFYAVGSGLGGLGATIAHAQAGWPGVCALGAAVSLLALALGLAQARSTPPLPT